MNKNKLYYCQFGKNNEAYCFPFKKASVKNAVNCYYFCFAKHNWIPSKKLSVTVQFVSQILK